MFYKPGSSFKQHIETVDTVRSVCEDVTNWLGDEIEDLQSIVYEVTLRVSYDQEDTTIAEMGRCCEAIGIVVPTEKYDPAFGSVTPGGWRLALTKVAERTTCLHRLMDEIQSWFDHERTDDVLQWDKGYESPEETREALDQLQEFVDAVPIKLYNIDRTVLVQ